ncbi:YHS domain-containing (seleno)protein [Rhodopseudomonas palustris]|uniref:YHS domain-containing (seleno)protein n=1 Tax=Rhodopseudomonas palustris TaxID=1076 RepID=UPI002ACD2CDD|nr:YHS domain-containing (seleno)protein [Rhodopseudomonas palustris]WQG99695.1 YHS domain-containing (seleno)protein [Rhodopseudomonas palustris]
MTAQRQEGNALRLGFATIGLAALLLCPTGPTARAEGATTERIVVDRHTGLAIDGFDPVAYFADGAARVGAADFEASAAGAIWRFRNASNRAAFVGHPEIYAPQFGGYDPVGVARGVPLQGNARIWLVAGQRLYLFSREDDRDAFAAAPERILARARAQWPGLIATMAE